MRCEIQERICDECGRKVQMRMITAQGDTQFRGWIRATLEGRDGLTSSLDFCSPECAGKHFAQFTLVPNARGELVQFPGPVMGGRGESA